MQRSTAVHNRRENMMKKIILDLCGGTGSWSEPYKNRGGNYDVRVITLPHYDIFEIELIKESGIVRMWNNTEKRQEDIIAKDVHGILAAPTCTMFSFARTTGKTPRDLEGGMILVQKCLEIIWFCRWQQDSSLKWWALENPQGYMRQFLGKPPLTFNPCDYGDTYTKKTDLWGFYNLPKVSKREMTQEEKERCAINKRILPELPEDYVMPEGWNKMAARRSMTSKKFAEAFCRANP